MASSLESEFTFNNVVFHHVPNAQAPGLLAAMLVFTFCLGIITLEILGNLRYDYNLIKRQGWKDLRTACNRISYLLCRYTCFGFLFITVIYMNLPGTNCKVYAMAINIMWVFPLIFVDLIFVQRTLAVYNWNKVLFLILGSFYIVYVVLCFYSVINFGYGYRIPFSNFCAYQTNSTHQRPHSIVFLTYICWITVLDTMILLFTTHKVIEGGLTNVFYLITTKTDEKEDNKAQRKAKGFQVGEISMKGLLLRQGIGYFLCLQISRLSFLIVYYTVNNKTSYQVLVAGILITIGPVIAGMLFRQTAEAVKRTAIGLQSTSGISQGRSFRSSLGGAGNFTKSLSVNRNLTSSQSTTGLVNPRKGESIDQGTIGTNSPSPNMVVTNLTNQEDFKQLEVFVEEKNDIVSIPMSSISEIPRSRRGRNNSYSAAEEGLPIHRQYTSRNRLRQDDIEEDAGFRFNATPSVRSLSTTTHGMINPTTISEDTPYVPSLPNQYNNRLY